MTSLTHDDLMRLGLERIRDRIELLKRNNAQDRLLIEANEREIDRLLVNDSLNKERTAQAGRCAGQASCNGEATDDGREPL